MPESISAVVPTFNRAAFLAEALDALLRQTRPPAEIVVWDDGSTDGTAETAAAAARRGRALAQPVDLRYFSGENGGKARALNAALAHVRGGYVWICDDDDIARPDAAARLAGALDENPLAGLAAGGYVRFREEAGTRRYEGPGYWPDLSEGSVLRHLLEDVFLFQNATLVRRECYRQVGPFREDLARSIDYDMIVRLASRYPVAMVDGVLFEQRKHAGVRGPLAARHPEARSETVWAESDREVFAGFRQSLPLAVYESLFEGEAALVARAGLLQRACVYARRGDWAAAVEDFEAAAQQDATMPFTALEWNICRRAMAGKHGVGGALGPDRRRLASLRRNGPMAAAISRALARGLVWRIRAALRRGAVGEAVGLTRLAAVLGGPSGRPRGDGGRLRERREYPPTPSGGGERP